MITFAILIITAMLPNGSLQPHFLAAPPALCQAPAASLVASAKEILEYREVPFVNFTVGCKVVSMTEPKDPLRRANGDR